MFRRIYLICISLAVFASCQKGEDGPSTDLDGRAVKFNLSIAGAAATRVTDNQWTENDGVGIYMIPYVGTTDAPADFTTYVDGQNKEYKATTTGEETDLEAVGEFLRYPVGDAEVSFVAYYPYQADLHKTVANVHAPHVYPVNLTDQTDPTKIDLLYSDTKTGTAYKQALNVAGTEVNLTFKHQLSKIVVKFGETEPDASTTDYSGATLLINGIPTIADFDLSTATFSNLAGATNTIIPNVKETSADMIVWEAIVVPHDVAEFSERQLEITLDGKKHYLYLPGDVSFEKGHVYTFSCRYESFEVKFDNKHKIDEWTFDEAKSLANVEDTNPLEPKVLNTQVEDGLTNCYIVVPGEGVAIPVARAFWYDGGFANVLRVDASSYHSPSEGEGGGSPYIDYTGEFETEIVWQTKDVIRALWVTGNGKNAILRVYTKRDVEGNAVVKAYKKGDTTKAAVWSWHIWVTKDDPTANLWDPVENGGGTTKQNVKFMDRNLGALEATLSPASHGLHYQWGRKDPFPLNDDLITIAAGPVDKETAIKNPATFYTVNSDNWLDPQDNDRWGYTSGVKTINDPCPAGFKVICVKDDDTPFTGILAIRTPDNMGIICGDDKDICFPFADYRAFDDGGLYANKNNRLNLYWTNKINQQYAGVALGFQYSGDTTWDDFLMGYCMAIGASIRCVTE